MNRKHGDESKRDREAEGGTVTQRGDKKGEIGSHGVSHTSRERERKEREK